MAKTAASIAANKRYAKTPKGKVSTAARRRRYLTSPKGQAWATAKSLQPYGITPEDYDLLLSKQGGGCAICGGQNRGEIRLEVDHNHETGEVRGLLCGKCNRGIGMFNDDQNLMRLAISYLARTDGDGGI